MGLHVRPSVCNTFWFPHISGQTALGIDIKLGGCIYYCTPQTWLTFGHIQMNFRCFQASDCWSSFRVLPRKRWSDWAQILQAEISFYGTEKKMLPWSVDLQTLFAVDQVTGPSLPWESCDLWVACKPCYCIIHMVPLNGARNWVFSRGVSPHTS